MTARLQRHKTGATPDASTTVTILAVGNVEDWIRHGRNVPSNEYLTFAEFHEVTRNRLDLLSPEVVVSPLLSHSFDCIDLAQLLAALDYKGSYRAIATTLPNPEMIQREIRSICPDLDFDILIVPDKASPRHS